MRTRRKKGRNIIFLLGPASIILHVAVALLLQEAAAFSVIHQMRSLPFRVSSLDATAASSTAQTSKSKQLSKSLHKTLQKSYTVSDTLKNVACQLAPEVDPNGSLSSLTLVRLSKHLITMDNELLQKEEEQTNIFASADDMAFFRAGLQNIIQCLVSVECSTNSSAVTTDSVVDGMKAAAVIFQIWNRQSSDMTMSELVVPLIDKLQQEDGDMAPRLKPHHLSGLQWALDSLRLVSSTEALRQRCRLPSAMQHAYDNLKLPFRIRPGFFGSKSVLADLGSPHDAVVEMVRQVDFQSDTIKTTSNQLVKERRQTAWQGDDNVAPFAYSGKSMPRNDWSPIVQTIRDDLHRYTAEYYDGCLLNFYPDGESGMRYHIDPDQGSLWGFETAVVSVGATRRFAFRPIQADGKENAPHTFVLFSGDVTEMFNDCQERYQHTVKTADNKQEQSSRVSLVFKKTLDDMRT
jgi:alkylated DNA repair dioxygenase AlkB